SRYARRRLFLSALPLATALVSEAQGQTFSWTFNGGGSWSVASNWTPAGPPTAASVVNVVHNDATVRAITMNSNYAPSLLSQFTINQTGTGTSTVTMAANTFGTTNAMFIGTNGKGAFVQNGGTVTVNGFL